MCLNLWVLKVCLLNALSKYLGTSIWLYISIIFIYSGTQKIHTTACLQIKIGMFVFVQTSASNNFYMIFNTNYFLSCNDDSFIMCVVGQLRYLDLTVIYHVMFIIMTHTKYIPLLVPHHFCISFQTVATHNFYKLSNNYYWLS